MTLPRNSLLLLVSLGLVVASSTACSHLKPRSAPFSVRPDSTDKGELVGPFSGQVSDEATGDPVPGALVYATWTYQNNGQPAGFRDLVVSTGPQGRYLIPSPNNPPEGRLTDFHLVIYMRGYVAYRSDRRFEDFGPRLDFSQRNNRVEMTRWHTRHSHSRHLRYIGGGSALRALAAWEIEDADAELSGRKRSDVINSDFLSPLSDNQLIAAQLLGDAEIKAITGFDGQFSSGPLNDDADTYSYSSQHFRAQGQPEIYDVAIRLWRLPSGEALQRFTELTTSLPGVTERNDVGTRSLLAVEGDIQGFAYLDQPRGLVVLITCGTGQCTNINNLVDLARRVQKNVISLSQ